MNEDDVTWANCTLRKWLNDEFYNSSFNEEEKKYILLFEIENQDNPYYGTDGGEDTLDHIFILGLQEAGSANPDDYMSMTYGRKGTYFETRLKRRADKTAYAEEQGEYSMWLLRSPGADNSFVTAVFGQGVIDIFGINVTDNNVFIRPAMWIDLNP